MTNQAGGETQVVAFVLALLVMIFAGLLLIDVWLN
jgi:hypothetical protein